MVWVEQGEELGRGILLLVRFTYVLLALYMHDVASMMCTIVCVMH